MSTKLWGGCFTKSIDDDVLDYTETTGIDIRLVRFDIWGSIAHTIMLNRVGIINEYSASNILAGLLELYERHTTGNLMLEKAQEDVHLNIEYQLTKLIGADDGGKLHTARSRNDQVVTDTRMYLRYELLEICDFLADFIDCLLLLAKDSINKVAIGYTHMQPAQPISVGFWYSSYASILMRDLERTFETFNNVNRSVLGSCALAGTSFPIDRRLTSDLLGFGQIIEHSLDATSSRDFVIQAFSSMAILMSNVSKLAEEIVIWTSNEFRLLKIDDAFATGSSIMPQKINPVVAELIKGRVGRVYGGLMQILTVTKGVTTGYNCDLQEDKPLLWDSLDTVKTTIKILHKHINTSEYDFERAEELCWVNFSTVTEVANMLVKEKNIPFREAHRICGELTQSCKENRVDLRDLKFVRQFLLKEGIDCLESEIRKCTNPLAVMRKQTSMGSTGPLSVKNTCDNLCTSLYGWKDLIKTAKNEIDNAEQIAIITAKQIISDSELDIKFNIN